ncbi:short chain dehydrogenase [Janibacter sp. HTCC2649]|uniref:SDR family NAD(P)-dependent oxidoreductase n=1 Tax=Janibacter sp. HTCC2649 TaxID=313589 RepID=UPI00006709BE|nr:SDR family NAD(P)-dependent oxidoreductase [Janibacter sp. HTCC2649]EAQ00612.1 short chain dehydrogenase [Janibacter sp. HTCC2649]
MTNERLLDGRVIIVTGGGRGLGRSHCLELAAHGATVIVNDLGVGLAGESSEDDPAQEVVDTIRAAGGTAALGPGSASDWQAMQSVVDETVQSFGRLDGIVNNAGILRDATIPNLGEKDWDAVLDVHLKGTFTLTHHACTYWRAEHKAGNPVQGRIINTTSGAGLAGNVGQAAYSAAKAGIIALTQVTAMEGSRYGVTANAISPIAATRMMASAGLGTEETQGWSPLDPENASPVVAWLCSEQSGWITGQVLRIDGNTLIAMEPWATGRSHVARSGERLDAAEIDLGLRRALGAFPGGLAALGSPAVSR